MLFQKGFLSRIEACMRGAFMLKSMENTWFLYDFRYLKALILKLVQTICGSIFPMPSEGRLSIDFQRILRAMGEDSEKESLLKPYEKNNIIFDVLSSATCGEKLPGTGGVPSRSR